MHLHPEIANLRTSLPAQPLTDAALAEWRARADVAEALAALVQFDAGAALEDCPALARLFSNQSAAANLAEGLIASLAQALAAEPLAQVPLGHASTPGLARLRLASHGRTSLTLAAYACRGRAVPVSALFEDGVAYDIVIAGAGTALVHRHDGAGLTSCELALAPGTRLVRTGVNETRQIIAVTRPLLVLQLTREAVRPSPSREIALADGLLIKTISGCKRASQQMMALAVLGALGHAGAVPVIARLAQDQAAERDLRWEALRQCLAMDIRAGLDVLETMAGNQADTLCAPAAALQRQLRERRPDLARFMTESA